MLLQRLYDTQLAQASYLIGCAAAGEAIVIDPTRDAEKYLAAAAALGVRIRHVTETHIHADFVSGSRELAARTGATMSLSDEGDAAWKYGFAAEAGARLLRSGDQIAVVSGLKPGDEVVTSGVFKLRNGVAVLVNNKIRPANSLKPKPENS